MNTPRTTYLHAELCVSCKIRHAFLTRMVKGVEHRHQLVFFSREALLNVDKIQEASRNDIFSIKRWARTAPLPENCQPLDYAFSGLVRIYWDYLYPIVTNWTTGFDLVMVQKCVVSAFPEPDLSQYPPEKADLIKWVHKCAKKFQTASSGVVTLGATCEPELLGSFWDRVTVNEEWRNERFPYLFDP